jgi:predicted anti-sigma-YlaC factor YlaD
MNNHEAIRKLLALLSAGALDEREEQRVTLHLRTCAECSAEFDRWNLLTGGLRGIPTPQPSPLLVQRARARAEARISEEAEYRWSRSVMAFLLLFAWVLTLLSWPLVRLVSGGLLGLLDPRLNQSWLGFAGFTTMVWVAGGAAAILLSLHQRRERRLA